MRAETSETMGEHTKAIWRKSTKTKTGGLEAVAVTIPPWAPPELLPLAQAAMQRATKGVALGLAPMAVIDPMLRGMIDVFLAGYKAGIHPGPSEPGIEEGARHLLTMAAKASSKDNREVLHNPVYWIEPETPFPA